MHLLPRVNLHQTGLKNGTKGFRVAVIAIISACVGFLVSDILGKQGMLRYYTDIVPLSQPEQEMGIKLASPEIIVSAYDGCAAFDQNRAAGCYPRMPPPTPKACGHCSSQIHLAPGADASTSVTVSLALDYDCGKDNLDVVVYVGKDRKKLNRIYKGSNITQYTSTACMAEDPKDCKTPAVGMDRSFWCTAAHFGTYESDWFHHIAVSNLEPNTRYYYKVEPSPCSSERKIFSFKTAPPVLPQKSLYNGKKSEKLQNLDHYYGTKIAITGDPGQLADSDITFRGVYEEKNHIDFFVITGDLSYANRDHRLHDRWFKRYEYLLGNMPLMVTPGNHDIETDCCDWSIFKSYEHRFRMPQIQPAVLGYACAERDTAPPNYKFAGRYDYGNSFYSVTIGPSVFIFLNTYTSSAKNSPQYMWLKDELARVDRRVTPWLFVVAHATIYETFRKHLKEIPQNTMKKAMEPLFAQYRVNAFFCGHDHLYARTHPVFDGKVRVDGRAPMYITIGNGGVAHQHDSKPHEEPWLASWDWWSYGFGTLTLVNASHAYWETKFHNNSKSDIVSGTDSVYIVNYADTVMIKESKRDKERYRD